MTYTKKTWTSASKITATAFNHLESQYSTLYTDYMYGHNHDTRYYPKATADSTFFWSANMGHNSGADGDLLDGHHASEITGKALPVGAIVMWAESAGSIPTGWHICDGTGGTVDLRNKFIPGAGNTYAVGDTMGSATVTPSADTVTVNSHTLTTAELPSHTHDYSDYYGNSSIRSGYSPPSESTAAHEVWDSNARTTSTDGGTGGGHTHTSNSVTYNSEANIPAYYALYFIQRTS